MKRIGRFLIAAGILMVAVAAGITIYNIILQRQSAQKTAELLRQLDIPEEDESQSEDIIPNYTGSDYIISDYILDPAMDMPVVEVDGIPIVGTISIPTVLEQELPIISEWSDDYLKIGPCRYEGTVYANNMIIAGHNYWSVFTPIKNMEYGDPVTITDIEGNIFHYTMVDRELIDGYDVEGMSAGDWDLTLFTCNYGGEARVAIRCMRTEDEGESRTYPNE